MATKVVKNTLLQGMIKRMINAKSPKVGNLPKLSHLPQIKTPKASLGSSLPSIKTPKTFKFMGRKGY